VTSQFKISPSHWKPLSPKTVAYKQAERENLVRDRFTGRTVAFTSPDQILVNFGVLRESVTAKPSHFFSLSGLPCGFNIGFFNDTAPPERIRYAWTHEFGTKFLISQKGWTPNRARGFVRSFIAKQIIFRYGSLTPLKIGKSDIEGKVKDDIERFINASRKLVAKMRQKIVAKKKVGGKFVTIPQRSILRVSLDSYKIILFSNFVEGLRAFIDYLV